MAIGFLNDLAYVDQVRLGTPVTYTTTSVTGSPRYITFDGTANTITLNPGSEISWRLVDGEVNRDLLDAIAGYNKQVEVILEEEEKKFTPPTEEELFDFLGFGGGESTE